MLLPQHRLQGFELLAVVLAGERLLDPGQLVLQPINLVPRHSGSTVLIVLVLQPVHDAVYAVVYRANLVLDGGKVVRERLETVVQLPELLVLRLELARVHVRLRDKLLVNPFVRRDSVRVIVLVDRRRAVVLWHPMSIGFPVALLFFEEPALFLLRVVRALVHLLPCGGVIVVVVFLVVVRTLRRRDLEVEELNVVGEIARGGGCAKEVAERETHIGSLETKVAVSLDTDGFEAVGYLDVCGGAAVTVVNVAVGKGKTMYIVVDGIIGASVIEVGSELGLPAGAVVNDESQPVIWLCGVDGIYARDAMSTSGRIPKGKATLAPIGTCCPKVDVYRPFVVRVCVLRPDT